MNELLWVAAKRTFTIPGPWPLVHLVSGVVNELLWVAAKRTFTVPGPWPLSPLVFTFGFLTCLTITAFTDGGHGRDAGALCGAAEAGSAADGF